MKKKKKSSGRFVCLSVCLTVRPCQSLIFLQAQLKTFFFSRFLLSRASTCQLSDAINDASLHRHFSFRLAISPSTPSTIPHHFKPSVSSLSLSLSLSCFVSFVCCYPHLHNFVAALLVWTHSGGGLGEGEGGVGHTGCEGERTASETRMHHPPVSPLARGITKLLHEKETSK